MLKENVLIGIVVSFILLLLLLTIYPAMESNTENIGSAMADEGNYTIENQYEEEAKADLWGVFIPVVFLATLVMIFTKHKEGDEE